MESYCITGAFAVIKSLCRFHHRSWPSARSPPPARCRCLCAPPIPTVKTQAGANPVLVVPPPADSEKIEKARQALRQKMNELQAQEPPPPVNAPTPVVVKPLPAAPPQPVVKAPPVEKSQPVAKPPLAETPKAIVKS